MGQNFFSGAQGQGFDGELSGRASARTMGGVKKVSPKPTVVQQLREALVARVHHAVVLPVKGQPSVLRIEGPGALSGAAEALLVGHEKALTRSGFRVVECVGVDPRDERGRHGKIRAEIPREGEPWQWQRWSGEEQQERVMSGDDGRTPPRLVEAPKPALAPVFSLSDARKKASRRRPS